MTGAKSQYSYGFDLVPLGKDWRSRDPNEANEAPTTALFHTHQGELP